MSIQPAARELFTLNVIQEMFRDESPNVGSFVKVNFEQKEIKIADEYAKVIIGQKQPIQANFEPSYFVSVSPASAFGGLFWKELSYNDNDMLENSSSISSPSHIQVCVALL